MPPTPTPPRVNSGLSTFVHVLESVMQLMKAQLSNDYLAGLIIFGGASALRDWFDAARVRAVAWIYRSLFTEVLLGAAEAKELTEFLRAQPEMAQSSKLHLTTRSDADADSPAEGGGRIYEYEPELSESLRLTYVSPVTGRRRWVWVHNKVDYQYQANADPEVTTTMTVLGRDKRPIQEILDRGRELVRARRRKYLQVITTYNYTKDNYGLGWSNGYATDKKQPGRSIHSVIPFYTEIKLVHRDCSRTLDVDQLFPQAI